MRSQSSHSPSSDRRARPARSRRRVGTSRVTPLPRHSCSRPELRVPIAAADDLRLPELRPRGRRRSSLYSIWPFFSNREVDQQDAFNTWEPTVANRHKVRIYPLKASDGTVTPNEYVVAFEETTSAYDYQDLVFIIRNVKPGPPPPPPSSLLVNFQPAGSPVPSGYVVDSGLAYSATRGYGWVTQASLSGTHVPLDLSPNTRDRDLEADQRLDTLIHMQYPAGGSSPTAVKTPGAWEYALANGSYQVTVAVGDPLVGADAENHVIHVEGVTAIAGYVPSGGNGSATRHATATVTVNVSDGRLTVDAIGGTNTKLDYVNIAPVAGDTTAPTVSAQLSGTQQSPGVYVVSATVTITASDTGGSVWRARRTVSTAAHSSRIPLRSLSALSATTRSPREQQTAQET